MPSDPWPIWGILVFLLVIIINGYFEAAVRSIDSAKTVSERENMLSYESALKALNVLIFTVGSACLLIAYWNPLTYAIVAWLGIGYFGLKQALSCAVILIVSAILFLGIGEAGICQVPAGSHEAVDLMRPRHIHTASGHLPSENGR